MSRRKFLRLSQYTLAAGAVTGGCSIAGQRILSQTAHRPWPLPETRWVMFMRWHDLVFLH
jgi:hypothetical protein